MATIRKYSGKKGTTFQAIIRRADQPSITKTFKRRSDATAWARKIESEMDSGKYNVAGLRNTLTDLVDDYYENCENPTARRNHIDYWVDQLGTTKLVNLKPSMISDELVKLTNTRADGKPGKRSPATVNRYLAALSSVLTYGMKSRHWIESNPARNVQRGKESKGRDRFLANEERQALLGACQADDDPLIYEFVLMAITTGARAGELLKLTWADVDFQAGVALLSNTKNGESRLAPLASSLAPLLRERRGIGRVFPFPNTTTYRVPFERCIKAAGITDFRFHDCRHTAASYLAQTGASLLEIAQLTGHKSLSMVQRYSHLSPAHVKKMGVIIEKRLEEQT